MEVVLNQVKKISSNGWLWLRIWNVENGRKGRLLLERCIDDQQLIGNASELLLSVEHIYVEVWTSTTRNAVLLSFIGATRIDYARWKQAGNSPATRWYELSKLINQSMAEEDAPNSAEDESNFVDDEGLLSKDVNYIQARVIHQELITSHSKPSPSNLTTRHNHSTVYDGFQFVLPRQSIQCHRRFHSIRVGQVFHEKRIDILYDLLSITLYGAVNKDRSVLPKNHMEDHCLGLTKALNILQLACQYAHFCAKQLHQDVRFREKQYRNLNQRKQKLQAKSQRLMDTTENLQREVRVLDCSIDGMRLLAQEFDPAGLERYQEVHIKDEK